MATDISWRGHSFKTFHGKFDDAKNVFYPSVTHDTHTSPMQRSSYRKCVAHFHGWRAQTLLDPSNKALKTNTFSTFPLFGPTQLPHIPIPPAIRSSNSNFDVFFNFSENVLPAYVGSTVLDLDTKPFTSKIHFIDRTIHVSIIY